MAHDLEIRAGAAADFDAVTGLLSDANLPVEDLTAESVAGFLVATIDDTVAGLIGLEHFRETGLLRSLVVDPVFRSAGLGRLLVAALESQAASQGVQELWLLTIDADAWFRELGYSTRQRDQVPDAILQTAEFSSLCPGDAVLMSKNL
jgi:amino-acid N-acetyltransferase